MKRPQFSIGPLPPKDNGMLASALFILEPCKGKIHTGGTHQSGNIDRVIFNLGGNGELKFNKERIELKFLTIYSEEYDNITSRNTFGL